MEEALKKTWVVDCKSKQKVTGGDGKEVVMSLSGSGGGICVHPKGLLLTTYSFPPGKRRIYARQQADVGFRKARIKEDCVWERFGVTLLWVETSDEEDGILFDYVQLNLPEEAVPLSLTFGDTVFGYPHQRNVAYSRYEGVVSYPFPVNVVQPLITDNDTLQAALGRHLRALQNKEPSHYEDSDKALKTSFDYWKLSHIYCPDDSDESDNEDYELRSPSEWHLFNPNVALIQISGFDMEASEEGLLGCPVFRQLDGALIGLVWLLNRAYCYLLPITFIATFVATLGPFDSIQRPEILFPPSPKKRKRT